jgi:hypothetical protein
MARSGTVWQAKSVAPWRSGVIYWHAMARRTQQPSHLEVPNPEAHPPNDGCVRAAVAQRSKRRTGSRLLRCAAPRRLGNTLIEAR